MVSAPVIRCIGTDDISATGIALAAYRYALTVASRHDEPIEMHVAVLVGDEATCRDLVEPALAELKRLAKVRAEQDDFGVHDAVAHQLDCGDWAVLTRIYT